MANQEHLDILKQGVKVWNKWRNEHSELLPDLSGTDLAKANLSEANLSGSYLYGSCLYMANLSEANLSGAYLVESKLDWINLHRASLNVANLNRTELRRAILVETDLKGSSLVMADLDGADLTKANLNSTDLNGANLHIAILIEASLVEADLRSVNLSGANLTKANLSEAQLYWTEFSGAELKGANLSMTWMGGSKFGDVDLRLVKGLEKVKHRGSSTIGVDTIYRSQGDIPETFLLGAGVPDSFIEYKRSLVGKPVDYYTCFISYSSQDQDFAERLYADLQSKGVRCWFAPKDLKIGDHYHQRIDESIRFCDKLILILSEYAVQSSWVEREVAAACEKEDCEQRPVLFPLRLDDAVMDTTKAWAADVRRRWHIGDFTCWKDHDSYQQTFDRLLRDLKAET